MHVIPLSPNAVRIGMPVPVAVRDSAGRLLVARGSTVDSPRQLAQLLSRGLFMDAGEATQFRSGMAAKVDSLVRSNANLGVIAAAQPDAPTPSGFDLASTLNAPRVADVVGGVNSLMLRASTLLQDPQATNFSARVDHIDAKLLELLNGNPDGLLMVLIHLSSSDTHKYSVSHALLVAAVCELASRQIGEWPDESRPPLRRAALTMNIAMTELQNQLVLQTVPLSDRQREHVDSHAARAVTMMRGYGVADELWLEAVARHHDAAPGPLKDLPLAQQLARVIQRADIFTARLSPRNLRRGLPGDAAARATYLDENQQADEAGVAIIKALGIYPPGSYVKLASGEIAVVLRRGRRGTEPRVASVISRVGTPLGWPAARETRMKDTAVVSGVPPHDVKLRLNLDALLQLM